MTDRRGYVMTIGLLSVGAALTLSACGGGGLESEVAAPAVGTISGTAVKGPVGAAIVTAYAVRPDGTPGTALGSAITDGQGRFMVSIGSYGGPLLLKMTGGSYTDEATGVAMNVGRGDVMTAAMPTLSAGSAVAGTQITPLTSMAQAMAERMVGGLSQANITTVNAAVSAYFMVDDIVHTPPMDPLTAGAAAGASTAMRNYGMVLAAMSQYAKNAGMTISSNMVTDFVNDAGDGVMDGMTFGRAIAMGSGMMGRTMMPVGAGTSGLAGAMSDFIASGLNRSGTTATDMATLMQQLANSNGHMLH